MCELRYLCFVIFYKNWFTNLFVLKNVVNFWLQYYYLYCLVIRYFQETFNAESSSEPRLDQSNAEHMLCTTCSELDYEKSERFVINDLRLVIHVYFGLKIPILVL
jgi:hypothetical protein